MAQPYEDKLADVGSLSDEELSTLETDIVTAFDEADAADDLDSMAAAADALDVVREELARREGGEEEAETPEETTAEMETGEEPEEGMAASAAPEGESKTKDPEAVVASAEAPEEAEVEIPAGRKPVVASGIRVTSGADIPGFSAGTEFGNLLEFNRAFTQRIHSIQRTSGRGSSYEQHVVGTVTASAPPERTLDSLDAEANWAKILEVVSPKAIAASGGYCAPLETRYEIFGLGQGDRPLRNSLPGFNASRGGIRFVKPPLLEDLSGAVGLWTAANDASATPNPASKPCLKVGCQPEETVTIDAITLCLEFGNLMSRAYPELVQRNNELSLIEHARFAERELLKKMKAECVALTSGFKLGTARDFLLALGKAAAAYRAQFRIDPRTPLRAIVPVWVRDAIREDIAQGLPGDRLAETDAVIDSYISARNVNVTWFLDDAYPATVPVAAGAVPDWPAAINWQLYAEGSFLFLDGGTLDLGVVRDSDLVGTNDYKTFVEVFESVAFLGAAAWDITSTTHVFGGVAATV